MNKLYNIMSCLLILALMKPPGVNRSEYGHFQQSLKSVEPTLTSITRKFIGHHTVSVEDLCIDECFQKRRANTQGVNNTLLRESLRVLGPLQFQNCIVCLDKSFFESSGDFDLTKTKNLSALVVKKTVKLILVDGNNNPQQNVSIYLYEPSTLQGKDFSQQSQW